MLCQEILNYDQEYSYYWSDKVKIVYENIVCKEILIY